MGLPLRLLQDSKKGLKVRHYMRKCGEETGVSPEERLFTDETATARRATGRGS